MSNPRITKKERGLLKGAMNRVFSRSELRQACLARVRQAGYSDPKRPRVTKWGYCENCGEVIPEYLIDVDHIQPKIPVHKSFEELTLDQYADALFCELDNLQNLCPSCHDRKSAIETRLRKIHRDERKKKK